MERPWGSYNRDLIIAACLITLAIIWIIFIIDKKRKNMVDFCMNCRFAVGKCSGTFTRFTFMIGATVSVLFLIFQIVSIFLLLNSRFSLAYRPYNNICQHNNDYNHPLCELWLQSSIYFSLPVFFKDCKLSRLMPNNCEIFLTKLSGIVPNTY